jgi:hypothetical protein
MIASAGALAQQDSAADLDQAERCLRRAGRMLDARFADHRTGSNEDWIRFHDRQTEAVFQAIERRLGSLAAGSEFKTKVESLRSHLESISTQFRTKIPGA